MKIKQVHAFEIDFSRVRKIKKAPLVYKGLDPAGPLERYPRYKSRRVSVGNPPWRQTLCMVEADDGTTGLGLTTHAGPVLSIINEHYRDQLVGEPVMATEKCFDMMVRMSAAYGNQGLTSFAISAVDLALWDLKGKLLQRPVYELLGGPQKERIFCYATGFNIEWFVELGFRAVKLPMPYGPEDGIDGLYKTEEMVADAREKIGDAVELMLDCWMALDVEYMVRLAEILKPYQLRWIEDYLLPDDMAGFAAVRRRLLGQGLATGEHWYLPQTFALAAEQQLVDIFQPDVKWVGGLSAAVRICHIAEAAGLDVVPHGGMNDPYGQHLIFALPGYGLGRAVQRRFTAGCAVGRDGRSAGYSRDRGWLSRAQRRPRLWS